jgi:hypothetical protein
MTGRAQHVTQQKQKRRQAGRGHLSDFRPHSRRVCQQMVETSSLKEFTADETSRFERVRLLQRIS